MKRCSKCKKPKPITDYLEDPSCRGGRSGVCRDCRNARGRKWKKDNSTRLAPVRRQQYADRYGAIQRQKEADRKAAHPLRVRCQVLRSGMRDRSRLRSLPFDKDLFTVAWLMARLTANPHCECCGRELDLVFKLDGKPNDSSPSIDRFIPERGYVKNNVAILCWRCNNLKRDASSDELRKIAAWMDAWVWTSETNEPCASFTAATQWSSLQMSAPSRKSDLSAWTGASSRR